MPIHQGVRNPTKTQFVPTCFTPYFNTGKSPAILSAKDPRLTYDITDNEIFIKNFKDYGSDICEMDYTILKEMVDVCVEHANSIDPFHERRLLTDIEILNGYCFLKRLDPHTSAGYPWKLNTRKKGKTGFMNFNEDTEIWEMDESVWQSFRERESLAIKGERSVSIWFACYKDECLKQQKIDDVATRIFIGPPMDFTMFTRKYFGCFHSWCIKNGFELGLAAGVDPESHVWNDMYQKLNNNGMGRGMDVDYKKYDTSIQHQLIECFIDFVNQWYDDSEQNQLVRRVIGDELAKTLIIYKHHIILKLKGNPSGNPLTMLMNSWIGIFLLMLFYYFSRDESDRSFSQFYKFVVSFVMGDDNVFSIHPEVLDEEKFINSIHYVCDSFKMRITSGDKTEELHFNKVSNLTFLQRKFNIVNRVALPCIGVKSIENMLIWVKSSMYNTIDEQLTTNIDTAFRFLFFYGKDVYNVYKVYISQLCLKYRLTVHIESYEYYSRMWNTSGHIDVSSSFF